jgi:hypothetical protein
MMGGLAKMACLALSWFPRAFPAFFRTLYFR